MRRGSALLVLGLGLVLSGPAAHPGNPLPRLFEGYAGERAALMIVNGRRLESRNDAAYSDATRFISWSMAKSVTAMLVGELVADGRLRLDDPAPVAEWRGDARRAITLRQLLHMSSGLRHIEIGESPENSDTNQVLFVSGTDDMAARAIARRLVARPGARYRYDSLTSIILSEIITRTLTASRDPRARAGAYRDFAEARLFRPARVTSAFLEFDGAGTQIGGSIMHMTLDDWGRMGQLLLDGKGPDGGQVIAPDWLAFLKRPSPTKANYGGHVWLEKGLASMRGHLGQFVFAGARGGRSVILVRLGKTQDEELDPVQSRMEEVALRELAGEWPTGF